jgi:hypothetical protein
MSLSSSSLSRFRSRVDAVLADCFPADLIILGINVRASSPGGRTQTDFIDGGQSENYRIPFRIPKSLTPPGWSPVIGQPLDWAVSETLTLPLEIIQTPIHPHEIMWEITARKRRQA